PGGLHRRARRPLRKRQVDGREPLAALLRRRRGIDPARRQGHSPLPPRGPAPPDRLRRAGRRALRRYDREQYRLRGTRRLLARRHRARRRGRVRVRVRVYPAGRARYRGRRARRAALGRAAPAHRDRARAAEERPGADSRRGDVGARHGVRAARAERAQSSDGRPHDARDRASTVDRREGRRDRRDERGPHRRDRHACRAARAGRPLRDAVPHAVRGLTTGRADGGVMRLRLRIERAAERIWYGRSAWRWPLFPVSLAYRAAVATRARLYRSGAKPVVRLPVPVIVVGNVTAGGTGKTPLVIWLAQRLGARGRSPGIVSRGYGGRATRWPQRVRPGSSPDLVGDEPVLIATRTGCPVFAGPDRVAAARALLAEADV